MTNSEYSWDQMRSGIESQPDYLRTQPHKIFAELKKNIPLNFIPACVYLVGCGDSWTSGLATFLAFEGYAGIPARTCRSLTFSRYLVKTAPEKSLVVLVSNSGKVSRTIEAANQAKKLGLYTIAVTGDLKSELAASVDYIIKLEYPPHGFAPATISYLNSMVVLYCLALYLAVINESLSDEQAKSIVDEITSLAGGLAQTERINKSRLNKLAEQIDQESQIVFVGGGPNLGTAVFSATKMLEALCINALGQDLEEWAHTQLLTATTDTYTFVIAPQGAAEDRAGEIIQAVSETDSKCIVICDQGMKSIPGSPDVVIPVFGSPNELLSPLIYCLPAEILALYSGESNQVTMLGFDKPRVRELNFQQIHNSKQI